MTPSRKDLSAVPTDQGDRADTEPKKGAKRDPAAFVGGGGTNGSSLKGPGLYGLLVESVQDYAIFALDPSGHILSWNEGAFRLKGYTADEIIGRHFSIFYPREELERDKPQGELEVAAREGRIEDEGWRIRKDGSHFWANVVITALRDARGRLVGYGKITRDLTERKEAEER